MQCNLQYKASPYGYSETRTERCCLCASLSVLCNIFFFLISSRKTQVCVCLMQPSTFFTDGSSGIPSIPGKLLFILLLMSTLWIHSRIVCVSLYARALAYNLNVRHVVPYYNYSCNPKWSRLRRVITVLINIERIILPKLQKNMPMSQRFRSSSAFLFWNTQCSGYSG